MDLKLVISLAVCHLVRSRPGVEEEAGLGEAISNLQLLNQIMIENTLAEQLKAPTRFQKPGASLQQRPAEAQQGNQKIYASDGPFSDIPSDAFRLQARKESRLTDDYKERVTKKDLSRHKHALAHAHAHEQEGFIRTCLKYFQGRSQPKPGSLELILDICTELLDTEGVDDFALDDAKRQQMYEFRAEGTKHHHHTEEGSVECECCPLGRGAGDELARSEAAMQELLGLFKPVGQRREWVVVNSQNPNERLRAYVDLKK